MASGSPLKKFMPENTAGMKFMEQVFGSDFYGFHTGSVRVLNGFCEGFNRVDEKTVKKNLNKPEGRHDPKGGRTCSRYFHEANFARIFEYDVCGGSQDNDHKKRRGACPTA